MVLEFILNAVAKDMRGGTALVSVSPPASASRRLRCCQLQSPRCLLNECTSLVTFSPLISALLVSVSCSTLLDRSLRKRIRIVDVAACCSRRICF